MTGFPTLLPFSSRFLIHPSIHFQHRLLPDLKVAQVVLLDPLPAVTGWRQTSALDKSPLHHRAKRRQNTIHTRTHTQTHRTRTDSVPTPALLAMLGYQMLRGYVCLGISFDMRAQVPFLSPAKAKLRLNVVTLQVSESPSYPWGDSLSSQPTLSTWWLGAP